MKRSIFLYIVLLLLFSSCHRDKNKKICNGSFIGLTAFSVHPPRMQLLAIDANNGSSVTTYSNFQIGFYTGDGVYNAQKNSFYIFSKEDEITLHEYNFSTNSFSSIGVSQILDTQKYWYVDKILCNSRANKLYYVSAGGNVDRIYEIDLTSPFHEKDIYAADSLGAISSPVIDENTGYIYFVSWPYLKKVDPVTGTMSIAGTYSEIRPTELQYNKNDGMFYGVDVHTNPYSFIKVDPKNGSAYTIASLDNVVGGIGHTFDLCNNRYILFEGLNTDWIDPSSGKVTKRITGQMHWPSMTYIEQPPPSH